MREDRYYIEINNRRCPGATPFVLEPDSDGERVRLQERVTGLRRQIWQAKDVLDTSRQVAGIVLYNLGTDQALQFAGRQQPLRMATWHADTPDPTMVWALRPSGDSAFANEGALMCIPLEAGYYASADGDAPCSGAVVYAWEWHGNANQLWLLRPVG